MSVYYSDDMVTLHHGDCREVLASLGTATVDAIVTDPPYELGFMGRRWDASGIAYDHEVWKRAYDILKPGGHLLAFGGTRTWHRLAVAIEDAGFEVRDNIAYLHDGGLPGPMCWAYGSGFPKSLDVSKAIYKRAGAERPDRVVSEYGGNAVFSATKAPINKGTPVTPAAQQWQGWGTALKPAHEPIVVARKPLMGTVAENVLAHGTGALNIDGCRIGTTETLGRAKGGWGNAAVGADNYGNFNSIGVTKEGGRWPANVILDESQAAELDRQSGVSKSTGGRIGKKSQSDVSIVPAGQYEAGDPGFSDVGGASRFFYVPKANASERPKDGDTAHPTVKPLDLMRYLVKLVTPPGGTVLEPFAGSGTTLEACVVEGFNVIGIELTEDYLPLIVQRVSKPIEQVLW